MLSKRASGVVGCHVQSPATLPNASCRAVHPQHAQSCSTSSSQVASGSAASNSSTSRRVGLLTASVALPLGLLIRPTLAQEAEPSQASVVQQVTAAANQVYLDVRVEGKPIGRITIQLFNDVQLGSERFKDLVLHKGGVGYLRSRFDKILPSYVRCEGPNALSYSADMESPIAGGDNLSLLEQELSAQSRRHDRPGLVSLLVRESSERPVKEKLIARDGKLVTVQQQAGAAPNGTDFVILRGAEPTLDATNLIVGQVVAGQDVVEAIAALPFAKPRDSAYDGPFFQVAKAMGDKRADTAELGFNRPLKRVIVSAGGIL